jgi:ribosome maturation factor RimP
MQNIIALLRPLAESYAAQHNLKLYDLAFRREQAGKVLRITLDGDVTLDKCATISRMLSAWIDEQPEGLIPYKYHLEVSSPGVDRLLKSQEDFASQIGKLVRIQTKEKDQTGRRNYKGRLKAVTDIAVTIYTEEESAEFTIDIANVKKANVEIEL